MPAKEAWVFPFECVEVCIKHLGPFGGHVHDDLGGPPCQEGSTLGEDMFEPQPAEYFG